MPVNRFTVGRLVRLLTLLSAAVGTLSRIVLALSDDLSLTILGFFTVQSNLLVLAFLIDAVVRGARGRRQPEFNRRSHGGVLLYILITAIIYNALLAGAVDEAGYSAVILVVNHTVTPILFLIDWALNHEREPYRARDVGLWLICPVAYAIYASVEGAITGGFRYFFLDFITPPVGTYLVQMVAVVLFFVMLSFLIVGANRLLVRRATAYPQVRS